MADNATTTTLSDAEYEKLQMQAGAATPLIFGDAFVDGLEGQMKKKFTTPEQVQEVDELVATLKNNPELSEALRTSVAQDGSVIRGMLSAGENDLAAVNDALAAPNGTSKFVDALKAIAENPDDHVTFDRNLRPLFTAAAAAPAAAPAPDVAPSAPASNAPTATTPEPTSAPAAPAPAPAISQEAFIGAVSGMLTAQDNSPEMRAAVNDLSQTLKKNPALTAEVQTAMADENFRDMMTKGTGGSTALEQLQDLNESLKSPANVTLFTKALTAINKDPNDNIDYSLVTKMTDLGKKIKKGEATQDDYRAMNGALADAGIVDQRIKMMADPSQIWTMFKEDPQELVRTMMDSFPVEGMSPEMRNMMAGALTALTQMASAFMGPDFLGHYADLGMKIGDSFGRLGAETMAGGSSAAIQEQIRVAGIGDQATPADLGSNIEIDDRRQAILSTRGETNAFGNAAQGIDPAAAAQSNRFDAQTSEWTQQRSATPAPVAP